MTAGGGGPLPKNGELWHLLRNGNVPDLPGISREFNDLIKAMTHPNPEERPSSTSIFNHSVLCPAVNKSKAQLVHELNLERQKNEMLMKRLRESNKLVKSYELSQTPGEFNKLIVKGIWDLNILFYINLRCFRR